VSGKQDVQEVRRGRWFSALLFVYVVLILIRAAPLIQHYSVKLLIKHSPSVLAAAALAAAGALLVFTFALSRWFRATLSAIAAVALVLIVLSGNLLAMIIALALLALTLLAGDAVSRLFRGSEAGEGDLSSVFAAGAITMGIVPLLLGEIGFLQPIGILAVAVVLLLLRWRRVPTLAHLLARSIRMVRGTSPPLLEALWVAAAIILIGAEWAGSLSPDLSADALAYHLPEALAAARTGRVDYLIDLVPQTYFWRNHETFLSLGFLFDGERVVGVSVKTPEGNREARCDLVIAADGRHSMTHGRAGLELQDFNAPIDVLWMRLSKTANDPPQSLGFFRHGKLLVVLDRGTYLQVGFVIPKGGLDEIKRRGLPGLHNDILELGEFLAPELTAGAPVW